MPRQPKAPQGGQYYGAGVPAVQGSGFGRGFARFLNTAGTTKNPLLGVGAVLQGMYNDRQAEAEAYRNQQMSKSYTRLSQDGGYDPGFDVWDKDMFDRARGIHESAASQQVMQDSVNNARRVREGLAPIPYSVNDKIPGMPFMNRAAASAQYTSPVIQEGLKAEGDDFRRQQNAQANAAMQGSFIAAQKGLTLDQAALDPQVQALYNVQGLPDAAVANNVEGMYGYANKQLDTANGELPYAQAKYANAQAEGILNPVIRKDLRSNWNYGQNVNTNNNSYYQQTDQIDAQAADTYQKLSDIDAHLNSPEVRAMPNNHPYKQSLARQKRILQQKALPFEKRYERKSDSNEGRLSPAQIQAVLSTPRQAIE